MRVVCLVVFFSIWVPVQEAGRTVPVTTPFSNNPNASREHTQLARKSKFLPFFTVVRFKNDPCSASDGQVGTCHLRRDCQRRQGVAAGTCARRIGVCCVVSRTCGGSATSSNNTYFRSPGYPEPWGGGAPCTLTITKNRNSATHVRLTFTEFSLAQPEASGACAVDRMSVTGSDTSAPVICGDNVGQHMFLKFLPDNPTMRIEIATNNANTARRRWNILVTQHENHQSPPSGCLMYFTGNTGQVSSFNYDAQAGGTREIANANYAACVRTNAGYCAVEWSQRPNAPFSVSGNSAAGTSQSGAACISDYLIVPNAVAAGQTTSAADRFCGSSFPTITSRISPFVLGVTTNGDESGDNTNRGFSLQFRQILCP